jgi:hypothetical protein
MGSILRRTTGRTVPSSAPPAEAPQAEASPEDDPPAVQEGRGCRLADVPWEQVRQAVADMCTRLNVPGAVPGVYDLYATVAGEWGKAHTTRD